MKANELRIGNLVSYGNKGYKRVDPNILAWFWSKPECFKLTPIPLTPEILEMAGFERFGDYFNKDYKDCRITLEKVDEADKDLPISDENTNWVAWYSLPPSKGIPLSYPNYLHQLQNLYFALTGQELTIDLNH